MVFFLIYSSHRQLSWPYFVDNKEKGESQNGCFEKTKRTMHVCVSEGNKCSFFRMFDVLCFLERPVLRFAILPYYRRLIVHLKVLNGKYVQITSYVNFTVVLECSVCHYWTSSFNNAWSRVLRISKSFLQSVGCLWWWVPLSVVLAWNDPARLTLVHHFVEAISHHHHHHHHHHHCRMDLLCKISNHCKKPNT